MGKTFFYIKIQTIMPTMSVAHIMPTMSVAYMHFIWNVVYDDELLLLFNVLS